jgi:hypothetical protein
VNDAERQRLEDAMKSVENMRQQSDNFTGNNGKLAPEKLKQLAKSSDTHAEAKQNLEKIVIPRLEKAATAAKKAYESCMKLQGLARDKKELESCADAKAFRNKHAKYGEDFKAFYEAGKSYVVSLILEPEDAKRLNQSLKGAAKALHVGGLEASVTVTMNAVEAFESYFNEFRAKWNALGEPAKAPPRPSAPPPKPK